MSKKYLTPKRGIGQPYTLYGTQYKIVVPYSATRTQAGYKFSIGHIDFLAPLTGKLVYDIQKMPASWLIDINQTIEE